MEKENNICVIELLMNNPVIRDRIGKLDISVCFDDKNENKIRLGEIDLKKDLFIIDEEIFRNENLIKSSTLVGALMRASLIKPDLKKIRKQIRQWDDIILGLDTNILYTGTVSSCILDEFVKIPSGNFIDTPDWVTLVLSKVAMGEIENRANMDHETVHRREALRAIQELMLINKSKDLEGISLFLAGTIPPSFEFSDKKNTIRDSAIREQFRVFLKNLDFHKGSYFLTQDFNNSVLAEAEGLISMYIKKPRIERREFDIGSNDFAVSELLYELAVAFNPVILEAGGIEIRIESNWQGKTLEDWEDWKTRIIWEKDQSGLEIAIDKWLKSDIADHMVECWKKLSKRYVSWLEYEL
jgi:hypothetical protein